MNTMAISRRRIRCARVAPPPNSPREAANGPHERRSAHRPRFTRRSPVFGCLIGAGAVLSPACTSAQLQALPDRYDLERPHARHEMPGRLDEISGLAVTSDGRIFAHDDEKAVIYEVDLMTGRATRGFSVGTETLRDDFEGLAIVGDLFFLISSRGALFEFREATPESSTPYRETDTGLGGQCEAEGLAHHAEDSTLLVACKTVTPDEPHVVIHRLPLDPAGGTREPIRISKERVRAMGGTRNFDPSGITVDPVTGHLVLVAARQEQLLEATTNGDVISVTRLSKSLHPQTEGVEFGPGGWLLMADEKNERDAALTVYAPG